MTDGCQVSEHSGPYQYRTDNARLILILLVITDLIFIALHALRWWFNSPNLALGIDIEGGYGEVLQYTKYLWAAILIGWFAAKNRAWRFASWSFVFLYFLADDCLAIHESLGALLATRVNFELPLGLHAVDFGEFMTLISAAATLAILVFAAQLGADRNVKHSFMELAALALILGIFGIVVDLLHGRPKADPLLNFMLGTLEDGGEMLAASLLVWYCFRLQNRCPVFFRRSVEQRQVKAGEGQISASLNP